MKGVFIPIKSGKSYRKVNINEILYVFQKGRITIIRTENCEISFYSKLSDLEKYLTQNFVHVLKHCVINFDKVERVENGFIYFNNGLRFNDIGISNFIKAKQKFTSYMFSAAAALSDSEIIDYKAPKHHKYPT